MATDSPTTPRRRRRSSYEVARRTVPVKRIVVALLGCVVLVAGAWGVRGLIGVARIFHTDPIHALGTLVGGHGNSDVAQAARANRRINIALYGYGGPGHDGAYLSDSIMVVSLQPQPSGPPRVAQVSIPRDWWVPIDLGNGQSAMGRVNTAYEAGQTGSPFHSDVYNGDQGGGRLADATLERMLGIHIDYFVGIDFTAFKEAVDSVGGVDVNVQNTFTDNNYPRGECGGDHPDCAVMTVHFDAGWQHMDGARALIFARSRESKDPNEGTNFARNKRQQLVLTAVKQRVLSVGGLHNLPDLLGALGNHVITNIPLDSALSLYDLTKDVDAKSITHVSIDDNNFIHECSGCDASVEYPWDRTFESIHHYLADVFAPQEALAEHAPLSVVDAGRRWQGEAGRWVSILGGLGFSAADGGLAPRDSASHVVNLGGGADARSAAWLAAYLGVAVEGPESPALPASLRGTARGVVVVIGGQLEQAFHAGPGLYTS